MPLKVLLELLTSWASVSSSEKWERWLVLDNVLLVLKISDSVPFAGMCGFFALKNDCRVNPTSLGPSLKWAEETRVQGSESEGPASWRAIAHCLKDPIAKNGSAVWRAVFAVSLGLKWNWILLQRWRGEEKRRGCLGWELALLIYALEVQVQKCLQESFSSIFFFFSPYTMKPLCVQKLGEDSWISMAPRPASFLFLFDSPLLETPHRTHRSGEGNTSQSHVVTSRKQVHADQEWSALK